MPKYYYLPLFEIMEENDAIIEKVEHWSDEQLEAWARYNVMNDTLPKPDWHPKQVAVWARKVLFWPAKSAEILIAQVVNGKRLLMYGSKDGLDCLLSDFDNSIPKPLLRELWAKIKKPQNPQSESGTSWNEELAKLKADVEELKLTRSSSAQVANNANKFLHVNDHEARRSLFTGSREGTMGLQIANDLPLKIKDDLQALIVDHFQHKDSLLCFVNTHKTPTYGMNDIPDLVFVEQSRYTNAVVASAIVGVMCIKLDKQLNNARGKAVSHIMELRKAQPERTEFYAFITNRHVYSSQVFIQQTRPAVCTHLPNIPCGLERRLCISVAIYVY